MYADIVPKLRRWLSLQCFQTMCEKVGAHARLAAGRSAHHSRIRQRCVRRPVCARVRPSLPELCAQVSTRGRAGGSSAAG